MRETHNLMGVGEKIFNGNTNSRFFPPTGSEVGEKGHQTCGRSPFVGACEGVFGEKKGQSKRGWATPRGRLVARGLSGGGLKMRGRKRIKFLGLRGQRVEGGVWGETKRGVLVRTRLICK